MTECFFLPSLLNALHWVATVWFEFDFVCNFRVVVRFSFVLQLYGKQLRTKREVAMVQNRSAYKQMNEKCKSWMHKHTHALTAESNRQADRRKTKISEKLNVNSKRARRTNITDNDKLNNNNFNSVSLVANRFDSRFRMLGFIIDWAHEILHRQDCLERRRDVALAHKPRRKKIAAAKQRQ